MDKCLQHSKSTICLCIWCGTKLCEKCISHQEGRKTYCEKCYGQLQELIHTKTRQTLTEPTFKNLTNKNSETKWM